MKTYNSPKLQVVGINKSDIIATSAPGLKGAYTGTASGVLAPGQRDIDSWYEGN